MYTTTDLSRWIGRTVLTIHRWTDKFSDFLSEGTRPENDRDARQYNRDDAIIIWTIYALSETGIKRLDDIKDRIESGERVEPNAFPDDADVMKMSTPEQRLASAMKQIRDLEAQIDQLKTANAAKDAVIQSLETQLKELYKLALKSRDS